MDKHARLSPVFMSNHIQKSTQSSFCRSEKKKKRKVFAALTVFEGIYIYVYRINLHLWTNPSTQCSKKWILISISLQHQVKNILKTLGSPGYRVQQSSCPKMVKYYGLEFSSCGKLYFPKMKIAVFQIPQSLPEFCQSPLKFGVCLPFP